MNPPVRAIFYDAGFTLIEPRWSIPQVCAEALRRRGHPTEAAAIAHAMPPFDPFLDARQSDGDHVFASDPRVTDLWHDYYRTTLQAVPGLADQLTDDELHECAVEVTTLYGRSDHWVPYPEVIDTLAEGRRRGFVQGVVSDWGATLTEILHGLGLTDYLDFVVVSAVVGAAKPNGHLFDLALARADVPVESIVYVGDNYRSDVLGGRGAGIRSVLLDRMGRVSQADCQIVPNLDSLLALIEGELLV